MRLFGLASGFDTEAMVKNLMSVERMRVDRYTQRKQINQWRQQDYNKINNSVANFILNSKKNVGLNKTSSTGGIKNQSWKNLDYVSKVTSSDKDIATAKVTGSAANGRFTVNVEQIAEDASYVSGKGSTEKILRTDRLNGKFIVDGIEIADKGSTIDEAIKAFNSNKEMKDKNISALFDRGTGRIFIQGDSTGKKLEVEGLDEFSRNISINQDLDFSELDGEEKLEKDLVIGGVTVAETGDNLQAIKDAINGENLEDETVKKIKEKLDNIDAEIVMENGKIKATKEISTDESSIKSIEGKTAKVTINGVEIESSSNNIEFNGLEINVKKTGNVIIEASTNTEGIMDKITGLVDEYNALLDEISGATSQERHSDYHPLSSEEKEAMSDRDVELWEEKAKSGLLKNDETLGRMMDRVRGDLYKTVEGLDGKFNHITQIGITTQKYSKGAAGGKLQIDEDKLRAAIEEDADGVMELMFGEGKKGEESEGSSAIGSTNKGIFTGIYDNLIDGMKDVINKSGPGDDSDLFRSVQSNMLIDFVTSKGSISELDKGIADMNKEIANLEIMLARKEDSYYAQFSRMEKYMYEMNSQSQWMMNQM